MGRLMSRALVVQDAEQFLVDISKGHDQVLGREFTALAQGLIGQFKREGGRFKKPSLFEKVHPGKIIDGDVIAFRQRPQQEPTNTGGINWRVFYATLLGIDISEEPVEIERHREKTEATVTFLVPVRNRKRQRFA